MKEIKPLTPEEEEQLMENRKNFRYQKVFLKDGRDYPLPHLEGAVRSILVDKDTMGAEDLTVGLCIYQPGSYHEKHAHSECEEVMYCFQANVLAVLATTKALICQGISSSFHVVQLTGFIIPMTNRKFIFSLTPVLI